SRGAARRWPRSAAGAAESRSGRTRPRRGARNLTRPPRRRCGRCAPGRRCRRRRRASCARAHGWYSNSDSPMRTVSPGFAPAVSRAAFTPRRSSATWKWSRPESESRFVRSTSFSTRSPLTRKPHGRLSTASSPGIGRSFVTLTAGSGSGGAGACATAAAIASRSSSSPSPVSADTKNASLRRVCARRSRAASRSSLFTAIRCGRRASEGENAATSSRTASKSPHGSAAAPSTTYARTRVRSTWRRNWRPSPAPVEAPSIRPGMSARMRRESPISITPSSGTSVVKGYAPTLGCAAVSEASSDDLPAFGAPTRPTSAMSFRSRVTVSSSPFSPGSAWSGACRTELLKWTLPRPPAPPRAISNVMPEVSRSAISRPSGSSAMVPTGTSRTMSAPRLPLLRPPAPSPPGGACHRALRAYSDRSVIPVVARRMIEPPRPPSPPSGPPRGTNGSCLKDVEPFPPCPARRATRAESMNRRGALALGVLRDRLDADAPPVLADALVPHIPRDEREERVVAAEADADPGGDPAAALPDEDRAGVHVLAGVDLHAEHLRVGVAAVARRAAAFLVRHLLALFLRFSGGLRLAGRGSLRVGLHGLLGLFLRLRRLRGAAERKDLEGGQVGARAAVHALALLRLVAKHLDARTAPVGQDLRLDLEAVDGWRADLEVVAVVHHEDAPELDRGARLGRQPVHQDLVAG